jgi:hypothetical protein
MKTLPLSTEVSDRLATFRRALHNPRIISAAQSMNIDLNNIAQEDAIVAQAETNYEASALHSTASPVNSNVLIRATRYAVFSAFYVKAALHAYSQVAAF